PARYRARDLRCDADVVGPGRDAPELLRRARAPRLHRLQDPVLTAILAARAAPTHVGAAFAPPEASFRGPLVGAAVQPRLLGAEDRGSTAAPTSRWHAFRSSPALRPARSDDGQQSRGLEARAD